MSNELLLGLSVCVAYGFVLFFYSLFQKSGLYVWTALMAITANIEVLILVNAFGLEQTLGNVLFASTFLVSDILSETEGKEIAKKCVKIGIASNLAFILISQMWMLYTPSANDWAMPAISQIFSNTPRVMLAGVVVYSISQWLDVHLYHWLWQKTAQYFGDSKKGLWFRNNGSTLLSQFVNAILFTFAAFYGTFEFSTLISIIGSSYTVFIVTSLLDTPVVYFARSINAKMKRNV